MEKEKENDYEAILTKEHHEYTDDDADDFCDWKRGVMWLSKRKITVHYSMQKNMEFLIGK